MKDYKRLTKRCGDIVNYAKPLQSNFIGAIYEEQKERDSEIMSRLAEFEDKIESGELCDREEVRKEILTEAQAELIDEFVKSSKNQDWVTTRKVLSEVCPVKVKKNMQAHSNKI